MKSSPQKDLDSILDAALDQLDDSDSDDDHVPPIANAPSHANAPLKPHYGPPPPPTSLEHLSLSAEEAELASSLEGMMKQFMNFGGAGFQDANAMQEAERAMEDMFQKMMAEEADAAGQSRRLVAEKDKDTSNSQKSKKKTSKSSSSNNNNNNNNNNKDNPKGTSKVNKKENNMDETINNLLNNIQQPTNIPPNIDPNLATLTDETLSTLLADLSHLTSSNDAPPIIDTVMKQLLDKELMYTPMKDVCTRFPEWLARNNPSNGGGLSREDYERYGKQYTYFQRIVRVYETEPENFERLMELMQDIQEYGQPPVEIIKELAPELEFDEEGMPIMNPGGAMPPFMPGMPIPGGDGEQCCIS
eukprot:CCRYP_004095-RA/>CCRYP_004095-RA protein AED:0.06 eAED:0.06 QI:178/1/1/1/1/1/2/102/358